MITDSENKTGHEPDEIIREVREIREAYSGRYGHDVRAILRKVRERVPDFSTSAIKPGEGRTNE